MKEKWPNTVRNDSSAQKKGKAHHFVALGEALDALEREDVLAGAVAALLVETGGVVLAVTIVVIVVVVVLFVVCSGGGRGRRERGVEGLDVCAIEHVQAAAADSDTGGVAGAAAARRVGRGGRRQARGRGAAARPGAGRLWEIGDVWGRGEIAGIGRVCADVDLRRRTRSLRQRRPASGHLDSNKPHRA